jgi:SAM-dependent methyltransferase
VNGKLRDAPTAGTDAGLTDAEATQRDYYDRIAAVYDRHYANPWALRYRWHVFDGFVGDFDFRGLRVLDAMCGGGESSGWFIERGALLTGVDISAAQCRLYRARHPGAECRCASILRADLPDDHFDFVITESLHHLPPQVDEGVGQLTRALKPGGHLMLWEPAAGSVMDRARRLWYRLDRAYFQPNEAAMDVDRLAERHRERLTLVRCQHGGNLAHLFVQGSMAFRIPPALVALYARPLLAADRFLSMLQGRRTACRVAALFRKPGERGGGT